MFRVANRAVLEEQLSCHLVETTGYLRTKSQRTAPEVYHYRGYYYKTTNGFNEPHNSACLPIGCLTVIKNV